MTSREDLYAAVWAEPLRKLAERFQVSDSYLARVCDSLQVPRPQAGYWAKKEAGRAPAPTPLPPALPGDPTEWNAGGGVSVRRSAQREQPGATPTTGRNRTHRVIQGTKADFLKTRTHDEWGYLRPYKQHLPDIISSQAGLDHALASANALFLALEERGHRVTLIERNRGPWRRLGFGSGDRPTRQKDYDPNDRAWSPGRLTVVHIAESTVGLTLVEVSAPTVLRYVGNSTYVKETDHIARRDRSRHVASTWTTTRDCPTGRLRLVAYAPHCRVELAEHWSETNDSDLSSRLPGILDKLQAFASKLPALVAQGEEQLAHEQRQFEAAQKQHAIREDKRRIEESTKESRNQLDDLMQTWAQISARSEFLEKLELQIALLPEHERTALQARLLLARELIGPVDPMLLFKAWKTPSERYKPRYSEESE